MDNLESNKLMAEFLGYKYYGHSDIEKYPGWRKDKVSHSHKINTQGKVGEKQYLCRNHKQLAFDTDWNWLMQVVEKIETYPHVAIFITHSTVHIMTREKTYNMIKYEGIQLTKKQAVYSACLQFIQNVIQ